MKKQTYRNFIVVEKGGHNTQVVKAPRAVTWDYARKIAYHWAEVITDEEDEDGDPISRRMKCEECAFVCPSVEGMEPYPESEGKLYGPKHITRSLLRCQVLGGIERGQNSPRKLADRRDAKFYALYCKTFAELESEGYIINKPELGYQFNS